MSSTAPHDRQSGTGAVKVSVVLGQWLDHSIDADLELAVWADELGDRQLWVPEMAKVDAPAFAATVAARTDQIELVLGPLAVTVRSPVQIALAAATVASTGRPTPPPWSGTSPKHPSTSFTARRTTTSPPTRPAGWNANLR